jgi:hypothetical protein
MNRRTIPGLFLLIGCLLLLVPGYGQTTAVPVFISGTEGYKIFRIQ